VYAIACTQTACEELLRVLIVSKACIVGIYQRKLEEMVLHAPDLSLTVIVPPFWQGVGGKTMLERSHTQGYRLEVQPVAFNGAFHTHFYPRLRETIARERPDLIHIDEEPYNFATYHANRLAQRYGSRSLWFSWQNLQRTYPPPFSWMEGYNLRHTDHGLVGSHTAAEVWRSKGYRGPLTVIPQFGVDPESFQPPGDREAHASVHFAYVGRLVSEKGVDLFLQALSRLKGPWRATLLGSGPAEPALRDQTAALGLADRVTFVPWLLSAEMPAFYQKIDVLVLPSRSRPNWTEQFGRVLIEAMACEVAVVGAQSGEIPHVIGDAGLTFPEDDVEALIKILDKLIDAPELRETLGQRGRSRVLQQFTQTHVAQATLDVYRQVCDADPV
jgi:glycosyltransferase involved in cell wall biosynthesis